MTTLTGTLMDLSQRLDTYIREHGLTPIDPIVSVEEERELTPAYHIDNLIAALRRIGALRYVYTLPDGTEREVPHPIDPYFDELVEELGLEGKEDTFGWRYAEPRMIELYDAYSRLMARLREYAAIIDECHDARDNDLFIPWEELEARVRRAYDGWERIMNDWPED